MFKRLGLGALTAGMLALAAPANAVTVDYEGLGFNNLDFVGPCPICIPNFRFSRIGDEPLDLLLGGIELTDPASIAANLGQAKYSVTGTSIDNAGGLVGGTVDFAPGTKVLEFGANDMVITGGQLQIKASDNTTNPVVTLPFTLGTANADYELEGEIHVTMNGFAMTFEVCEEASVLGNPCFATGDDRPWEEFGDQPYNTMNVGDGGGAEDITMFLYMKGNCADELCPFFEAGFWYHNSGNSQASAECARTNGQSDQSGLFRCKFEDPNSDIYIKLALWGAPEAQQVPEPATLSLFGLGLLGLGYAARRRRAAA